MTMAWHRWNVITAISLACATFGCSAADEEQDDGAADQVGSVSSAARGDVTKRWGASVTILAGQPLHRKGRTLSAYGGIEWGRSHGTDSDLGATVCVQRTDSHGIEREE